jgi:hypothetical protein
MRTGRTKKPLMLTEEERERLESLAHQARSQAQRTLTAHSPGLIARTTGTGD